MQLTQSQQKFINCSDKNIRLLAPAGCGKTFSIVQKARSIFSNNPRVRINIFTFTRGAADEIRERCDNNVCVTVNTLNSWGNSYVKSSVLKNAHLIVTPSERRRCMLNDLQLVWDRMPHREIFGKIFDKNRAKGRHAENIMDFIDVFKNIGFIHTEYTDDVDANMTIYDRHTDFVRRVGLARYYDTLVGEIIHESNMHFDTDDARRDFIVRSWIPFWRDCCNHMQAMGKYTLDDQKYFANIELIKKLERGERWNGSAKMDYIFIDEFQDTSPLDLMLISNLQQLNDAALIIVGDDDQAIYEFRGAAPYFILHPEEIFNQPFTTVVLDENFRSPANIVQKSMTLIANNKNRIDKHVVSSTDMAQAEIALMEYETQSEMIDAVIDDIRKTLDTTNDNIAVLSRLKASLLPYQVLLTKEGIDYLVSDDLAFFLTGAAESLKRVIPIKARNNKMRREDLVELVCLNSKHEVYKAARDTLGRIFLRNNVKPENMRDAMVAIADAYPREFGDLFTESFIESFMYGLEKFLAAQTVYETLDCLLNNFDGLKQNYSRSLEDIYYRDPPLVSLLDFASKYGADYDGFLEDFEYAIERANATTPELKLTIAKTPRVTLSTALRVKGQQYDKVIILNTDDGIWPKSQSKTSDETYEAERRLFYVAVTRSKKSLHLYRANELHGEFTTISPFIHEGNYDK